MSFSSVAEWAEMPTAMVQSLVESLVKRADAVIAAKGNNSQLMAMVLEWNVQYTGAHILRLVK